MARANRKRKTIAKPLPDRAAEGSSSRRANFITALVAAALVLAGGLVLQLSTRGLHGEPQGGLIEGLSASATYVGSEACAGCHQAEAQLWRTSHHKQAMDHATEKTVLGDFADGSFEYYGMRSRFFRKDGKFVVETDGADGKVEQFEVKYTFGVYPLQQYLVEFPDGRVQALPVAWDTRAKEQGGQRWFHLYPKEEIRHDDVLHWTKLNQNWNFMCSECHSTGVRKNYDAARDLFATSFAEISVAAKHAMGQDRGMLAGRKKERAGGRLAKMTTRQWG